MICNNPDCKHEIPDEALFCPDCGWKQSMFEENKPQKEDTSSTHDRTVLDPTQSEHSLHQESKPSTFTKEGICYYRIQHNDSYHSNYGNVTWIHSGQCGGEIFLGDNATCICNKCGAHAPIIYWNPQNQTDTKIQYVKIDMGHRFSYQEILAIAGNLSMEAGIKWLRDFTRNLIDLSN